MNTANSTISCPHCHKPVEISSAIRTQLIGEFTQKLQQQRATDKIALQEQLQQEKKKIEQKITKDFEASQAQALIELKTELQAKTQQIQKLEDQELHLRKREREFEEMQRKQELLLERKLTEEKSKWMTEYKQQEEQLVAIRLQEKDKQMEQLQKTIEELRRQSQQGSMQVQGDAAETDLKSHLQLAFPMDEISDVPTGMQGADLIHIVKNSLQQRVGLLLWERKRTKSFSEQWITKLKSDQVECKADIAILVSDVLPKDSSNFFERKGIWICHTPLAVSFAKALRSQLISVSQMKAAHRNTDVTLSQLYSYVTTPEFKSRVEQLVLTYIDMKQELDREERALRASIQRRTKQLDRLIASTAGLYGDFQGIIGSSLPKVDQLELHATDAQQSLLESQVQHE